MTDNQSNKSRRNILKFTKKPNFRSFKVLVSVMVLIGLGLFGFSSYYWYQNIFLKPDNVFWGMIDNSLQASSLTKKVEQTDGTSSQTERYYLQFTPQPLVKTVTDVEQIDKTRKLLSGEIPEGSNVQVSFSSKNGIEIATNNRIKTS